MQDERKERSMSKPEQRSMAEIRRLVAEDNARFSRLVEAWEELTRPQQDELVKTAEAMRRD